MILLHAFSGVFSLIIVVLVGYFLSKKGWVDQATFKMLPKLITNICLPPYLAFTIITALPNENFLHLLKAVAAPFFIISVMFALAFIIGKILRVGKRHFGLFCASISNSNTIFIGIPVNMALFGNEALPYVLFYYFAGTIFFWTFGNYFISRDETADGNIKINAKINWKQIVSPPMIGFLTGLILMVLQIELPQFLLRPAEIIGQMTTPLALIFIGITLEKIGLSNLTPDKDIILALTGRLFVCPLFAFICIPIFNLPELMGKVYVMQSALPVLMQVSILSAYYNTDPQYGTLLVALSTIICVVTIPLWMVLI